MIAAFAPAAKPPRRPGPVWLRREPVALLLSDPARGFSVALQRARAPAGAAVIERTWGAPPSPPAPRTGPARRHLATLAPKAARKAGLDGVHWPSGRLSLRLRSQAEGLFETGSAHSRLAAALAIRRGLLRLLVSTAFASRSPSAGRPLGPVRLAALARALPRARIYALGGVNARNVRRLAGIGLAGFAMVSAEPMAK